MTYGIISDKYIKEFAQVYVDSVSESPRAGKLDNYPPNYSVVELPVSAPHKVIVAIRAAQNVKNWGYRMAVLYCRRRGVASGVLDVAIWCRTHERRAVDRLPLFLLSQAE